MCVCAYREIFYAFIYMQNIHNKERERERTRETNQEYEKRERKTRERERRKIINIFNMPLIIFISKDHNES